MTAQRTAVPVVVCGPEPALQEAWGLASRRADRPGSESTGPDGRRFTGEETFRAVKNPRVGLGRQQTQSTRHARRDRRFLLAVLAQALLTRRGQAGPERGLERRLGAARPGQFSRFRQGLLLDELRPTRRADRLRALMTRFGDLVRHHGLFTGMLGVLSP